jgi:UDP-glucose 4-epimerase
MPARSSGLRVLITGVADRLGAELARSLQDDPEVGDVYGIDVRDPRRPLGRTEFVHADTRHSVIAKLVRELRVQVVVHCAVVTHQVESVRAMHETNVIGTMNVLAACAGETSPVEHVVVKSSTAIYGVDPTGPSFLTESMAGGRRRRGPLQVDLLELEQLAQDFALRNPHVSVTVLRLADVVDRQSDSPLARYLSLPVVPTAMGFDPRIQFLHGEDAVEVLRRAVFGRHRGVFNVAAPGVLSLSQAILLAGGRPVPLLSGLWGPLERLAVTAVAGVPLTPRLRDLITHGQAVDCSLLLHEFGWEPAYDNRAVMAEFAHPVEEVIEGGEVQPAQERQLESYLLRRRLRGQEVKTL